MRILLVSDITIERHSGIARSVRNLASGLCARGHATAVCAPEDAHPVEDSTLPQAVATYLIKSTRVPGLGSQPIVLPHVAGRQMRRLIGEWTPTVVHVVTPFGLGLSALRAATDRTISTVLSVHLVPENTASRSPTAGRIPVLPGLTLSMCYRRAARRATVVSAPTQPAAEIARRLVARRSCAVISNGIPPFALPGHQRRTTPAIPQLLYVGRLSREKRIDVLLEAFATIVERRRASLVIVGDGPERTRLSILARSMCGDAVRFTGEVADRDLVSYYHQAAVFCMPSTSELECIAALEAIGHGLPVVAARVPAFVDLASWSHACVLFQPDCPSSLADAVGSLLADEQRRTMLSENAIAAARQRALPRVIEQWERLYRAIARPELVTPVRGARIGGHA